MTLFAMFSHLGLLLCLCWTMAFVAIYDSDDAFWYPFITFNSLQVRIQLHFSQYQKIPGPIFFNYAE